jgi:hypothetical protein
MTKRKGRKGPMSPAEILARNAAARGQLAQRERLVRRTPAEWGVSAEIVALPTAEDVTVRVGNRGRVVAAKRSDPFDLLHAGGGLDDDQHRASRRLFRDWCLRAGVRDQERQVLDRVDGQFNPTAGLVSDAMIDAAKRIEEAMRGVGQVNAKIFAALIEPMVVQGAIIAWRGTIERVTGETERHVQGAMVRQACEALRLHYIEADDARAKRPRPAGGVAA